MHQIDNGILITFLKAILRNLKYREFVESTQDKIGLAAKKLTLRQLEQDTRVYRPAVQYYNKSNISKNMK